MSESLRNDGRVWVPKNKSDDRSPHQIPEDDRDYYLERLYPAFGNLVPRDVASRRAKEMCDKGLGVGSTKLAVYLDFKDIIDREGRDWVEEKYGNLFDMYKQITGSNPYESPMMIYPAVHYTMGGLWVDYNLMSNISGLFVIGEANFSDHGANRLGASALMQGLADGYFILPYTIGGYLSTQKAELNTKSIEYENSIMENKDNINRLLSIQGTRTVDDIHKELGKLMWNNVGMSRNQTNLEETLEKIPKIKDDLWNNLVVPGVNTEFNPELEKAGRLTDFIDLGLLMTKDALARQESCGGHFRSEYQTDENEAKRNDENCSHVSAWEYNKNDSIEHQENLTFENVKLANRSYK